MVDPSRVRSSEPSAQRWRTRAGLVELAPVQSSASARAACGAVESSSGAARRASTGPASLGVIPENLAAEAAARMLV